MKTAHTLSTYRESFFQVPSATLFTIKDILYIAYLREVTNNTSWRCRIIVIIIFLFAVPFKTKTSHIPFCFMFLVCISIIIIIIIIINFVVNSFPSEGFPIDD